MKTSKVEDKDTIILVMGRGGSDPDANSDFYKLTRLLWERTAYKSVESCFIAIAKPSLPEGLERCLALGARKIVVLPYLLFTGVLMKQFSDIISQFAAGHPEVEVEQGSYLGSHPLLSDMLAERIEETLEGQSFANCDNCKYRVEAAAHHHHHHHHGEEGHEEETGTTIIMGKSIITSMGITITTTITENIIARSTGDVGIIMRLMGISAAAGSMNRSITPRWVRKAKYSRVSGTFSTDSIFGQRTEGILNAMIFMLCGTSDARELALTLSSHGLPLVASVVTPSAAERLEAAAIRTAVGRLDQPGMISFCRRGITVL